MRSLNLQSAASVRTAPPATSTAAAMGLQQTKWLFAALCFYILSQAYTIPVLTVGPWALWPRFADVGVAALLGAFVWEQRHATPMSQANKEIFGALVAFLALGFVSYVGYLAFLTDSSAKGVVFGAFQIYTLVKFYIIFWVVARIPLPASRLVLLRRITDGVLLFVSASIIVTYLEVVSLPTLAPHIPADDGVSGPWADYQIAEWPWERRAWGTIGYNHAYVAAQVTVLIGLRVYLSGPLLTMGDSFLLAFSVVICFLSNSRSGLVGMIFLAAMLLLKRPAHIVAVGLTTLLLLPLALLLFPQTVAVATEFQDSLERQSTLLDADNADNLSGRDQIWQERIAFLDEEPHRWIVGSGFGAAVDSGNFAHMLPLHITIEVGAIGLFFFAILFYLILTHLYRRDVPKRTIFWMTVALLITSLTQETFYPAPALGHFMGFYLCVLAIVFRDPLAEEGVSP